MEGNFLNQNSYVPFRSGVFQFDNFYVFPCVRRGICSFGGLLRALATLFLCCLSIRLFRYDLSVPIHCSKIFLLLSHSVVGMASSNLPLLGGRIFSLFWIVLFYLYCLVLPRYLFSLPSFASSPSFIFRSSRHDFSVSSGYILMFHFRIRSLFICDSSLGSHPNFAFLSGVFRGTPIFSH